MITATESADQTIPRRHMPGAVWHVPCEARPTIAVVEFMKKFDAEGAIVGPVEVDSTILLLASALRTHSRQCGHRYSIDRYRVLCLVSSADGARSDLVYLSKRWFLECVAQPLLHDFSG